MAEVHSTVLAAPAALVLQQQREAVRQWVAQGFTPDEGLELSPRVRMVQQPGCLRHLGRLAQELGGKRVLLVTDKGIARAGHVGKACDGLRAAGLRVKVYDEVRENPTTQDVAYCLSAAREVEADLIIGLGGGSSMDTAKGCNFLLTNGGRMQDYWGVGKATKPMLPMIAVPTTAGTGSECQSFALIADEQTHQKMACGDEKALPRIALLDPELTVTQPRAVTVNTGVDAWTHAVESAVTRRRSPLSQLYSREAFALLAVNLPRVLREPANLEARARMQAGAALAGAAIENSMLGAAHSAANPLTARFGVVHGQAVGVMLPWVIEFNASDADACRLYRDLAVAAGLAQAESDPASAPAVLASATRDLLALAHMPARLAEHGVTESAIAPLSLEAAKQWTAAFNPRAITAEDFERLYRLAF